MANLLNFREIEFGGLLWPRGSVMDNPDNIPGEYVIPGVPAVTSRAGHDTFSRPHELANINENESKSMKIDENQGKSMKINGNQCKSMKISENSLIFINFG